MQLPDLKSVEDLISMALLMERLAAARFRSMAESMRERDRPDLAELFEQLAIEEDHHEAGVWRTVDVEPPADGLIEAAWPAEFGSAPSPPDPRDLARKSPYECLAEAVRNDEKAFTFFSYIAANSTDPRLREKAEALAREELEHAHRLRQARREAYHDGPRTLSHWPKPQSITDLEIMRQESLLGETALRDTIKRLRSSSAATREAARASDQISESLANGLNLELIQGVTERMQSACAADKSSGDTKINAADLDSLFEQLEDAFEFYDSVSSFTEDEDVRLAAQYLCTFCVERLKVLRAV
jgi:rubrerythrin